MKSVYIPERLTKCNAQNQYICNITEARSYRRCYILFVGTFFLKILNGFVLWKEYKLNFNDNRFQFKRIVAQWYNSGSIVLWFYNTQNIKLRKKVTFCLPIIFVKTTAIKHPCMNDTLHMNVYNFNWILLSNVYFLLIFKNIHF